MSTKKHLHLVSDATGETIHSVARACRAQFDAVDVTEHVWSMVRTPLQLEKVKEGIRLWPGLVLFTFVDEELRRQMDEFCRVENYPHVAVLDQVMVAMAGYLGAPSSHMPGKQHLLDADYFRRIEAMDYTLAHDDGRGADKLDDADVILLGVSRSSKTPTCVYLANRGVRAANIPLVPGVPLPDNLKRFALQNKPLLVGLTMDPEALTATRRTRLRHLGAEGVASYADHEKVREELDEARHICARLGCAVLDVTRRSIEETAADIMAMLNLRTTGASS